MISVNKIAIRFGGFTLFENLSFLINDRDRIGLVGRNGIGKSTLMKVLDGQMEVDEGDVAFPSRCTVGYLPQHLNFTDTLTVMQEVMLAFEEVNRLEQGIALASEQLASRDDYESEAYLALADSLSEMTDRYHILGGDRRIPLCEQTIKGLGFRPTDFGRYTGEFSGGWRMRIELAKLILKKPDLLMLDEPTNHLDIESIEWLEGYLKDYPGAVLLISHDRNFLDNLTNRTLEIANRRLYDYPVPYSKYVTLMQERLETQQAAYDNQQRKVRETQEFIERFRYKATKAAQVQSRVKSLERMEMLEVDKTDAQTMSLRFLPSPRAGAVVVECEGLSVGYGGPNVLEDAALIIERGEKVSFVGRNGEGKSTMVKVVLGELAHSGVLKIGHNVQIGYFAQNQNELLNPELTVFQTLDTLATGDLRSKTRDILGAFLFSGQDVDKKVKVLSGGEKSRLALACMLLEPFNLLILDEPTHHLDMVSKNILKQALLRYDGALIIVSHDRDFLDGLTYKVYEFRDKRVREHRGGITAFLEKRRSERQVESTLRKPAADDSKPSKSVDKVDGKEAAELRPAAGSKQDFARRKEQERDIRKAQNAVAAIEKETALLEAQFEELKVFLSDPANIKDREPFERYNAMQKRLAELGDQWVEASEKVEELERVRDENR